jgi:hypothetical protein
LPVTISSAGAAIDLLAVVDTGAAHCLFQRERGELLNLDIESGEPKIFSTATGRIEMFGHTVEVQTFDLRFESLVYFFADERINKNLLGRIGWLDRVRLGIVDHDQRIYLAAYDLE